MWVGLLSEQVDAVEQDGVESSAAWIPAQAGSRPHMNSIRALIKGN
jgi:hypothetical protein